MGQDFLVHTSQSILNELFLGEIHPREARADRKPVIESTFLWLPEHKFHLEANFRNFFHSRLNSQHDVNTWDMSTGWIVYLHERPRRHMRRFVARRVQMRSPQLGVMNSIFLHFSCFEGLGACVRRATSKWLLSGSGRQVDKLMTFRDFFAISCDTKAHENENSHPINPDAIRKA